MKQARAREFLQKVDVEHRTPEIKELKQLLANNSIAIW